MERQVVAPLLKEHPYSLFVFSNVRQDRWHFLNVKLDDDLERRRLFRRITVGPEERLRTACERLDLINLANLRGHAPIAIQKLHDDAFDVEPVTKEFFQEYGRIFDEVEAAIRGIRDKERKRLFTQRLFNRIMFIAFIQKKGWLTLAGDTDYLSALWRSYQRDTTLADKNCYRDRFKPLFFFGLNSPNEVNQVGINRGGFLRSLIGEIPYLNGGLFEEDEDDRDEDIAVPDEALDAVLNDLFARFNFTVTESTPLDTEVAVDPEMLGKVFEELVTGRHETGSYYTPKPIVAFMCREALKGRLTAQLPKESKQAVESFVDSHQAKDLSDAEGVLEALRKIKVCDPACGSGAYLVGMLHELLDLRSALFVTRKLDAKSAYDRKLEIIQNNLYGVDQDPFAVNIARLRLWLSLSVEYEGQSPPPLPNLDYKVESGNTVCSQNPSGFLIGLRKALVGEYLSAKAEYMTAHNARKVEIRKKISALRADIATWSHRAGDAFDWPIEFAEVFADGGFDVILANPPYVRQELIGDQKPTLAKLFPEVYSGLADLYCYFYARALQLLRKDGMLAFISSDKWLRAGYGAKLRKELATSCTIFSLTDFGDLPVFDSATTYPMILVAQKGFRAYSTVFTQVLDLQKPYPDVLAIINTQGTALPHTALNGSDWALTNASSAEAIRVSKASGAITLNEYVKGQIFYGVKTGLNAAFVISGARRKELIEQDSHSAELIKPLAVGKDIRRWQVDNRDRWLIYSPWDLEINEFPAIKAHLAKWKSDLSARPECAEGRYRWWCMARYASDYVDAFYKPKIIYQIFQVKPAFAYDTKRVFVNNAAYLIPVDDLYLLGVLNSESCWHEISRRCSPIQNGYQLMRAYFEKVLIPVPDKKDRTQIEVLVAQCLASDGLQASRFEKEINERVAALYEGHGKLLITNK
jgi:type I restriction-modification system DNA methylase subunit